jgi:putative transposase
MPWKVRNLVEERVEFVQRAMLGDDNFSELCREYGISRPTGYKFLDRYLKEGRQGLYDQSRRPNYHPHRTEYAIEELIIGLREKKPTWGPKKLCRRLKTIHPGVKIPSPSTIGTILSRNNVRVDRRKRRRRVVSTGPLGESAKSNDIWCIDFKGQFRLGNGKYCYPLTVSDHYSRYLLGCEGFESTKLEPVMMAFERIFNQQGLPYCIRSDNGTPFASTGLKGWSRLSVWFLRLGIKLERIAPGHPEQNGRHERMHWTLKQEVTRPAAHGFLQQQEKFDEFIEEYNQIRPHEALEMETPASVYKKSERLYPERLEALEYPTHDVVCRVGNNGQIYYSKRVNFYLSTALAGERVGLREIEPRQWLVSFMSYDVGMYDESKGKFWALEPVTGMQ